VTTALHLVGRLRRALSSHLQRSESGVTFVIFAMAIIALLGMVAVGVDGGRLYDERRQAQNAADHAATTAAHALCVRELPTDQAAAAGVASAATNGYDDDGTSNAVTVSYVSGTRFTADVWTQIPSTFAGIIGWSTLETSGSATAECIEGAAEGIGAIYAGGTCPNNKYGVDIPGSNQTVTGGVHTNAKAHVGGSSNEFDLIPESSPPQHDPFTHVAGFGDTGGGNVYEPGYPSPVPMPDPVWPDGWDPAVVTGGGGAPPEGSFLRRYYDYALAHGTLFSTKVTSIGGDGVYYTTSGEGMDIGSVAPGAHNVVLVAPSGPIKISASSTELHPFNDASFPRDNILMLSNMQKSSANQNEKKCDEYTIAMSGSNSDWNGIIWAPGGLIEMSGSLNDTTFSGTLIGWAVRLNGSNLTIAYQADLFEGELWIQMVD